MAEATQIPRRYLHRVLQQLAQAGLVRSQPGPNGGYSLVKAAEKIKLIDVVAAFGSIERIRKCPLGLKSHKGLCALHRELDEAYASIEKAFSRVTVAQIVDKPSRYTPLCEAT
jgi:Rrf2 family protein